MTADPSAHTYQTYGPCLADGPPCCEACAEVAAIAETDCSWCGEPIGYWAQFRYGANGLDLFHADPCWAEVHHDRPAPDQTAAEQAGEMDDQPFQYYGIGAAR